MGPDARVGSKANQVASRSGITLEERLAIPRDAQSDFEAQERCIETQAKRIAELEAALRKIYSACVDPEGMSDANTIDLVRYTVGLMLGVEKDE